MARNTSHLRRGGPGRPKGRKNNVPSTVKASVKEVLEEVALANRDEKIGRKIRDAETKKIPFMLVVGEREAAEDLVSVRKHGQGDQGSVSLEDFVQNFKLECAAPA